MLSSLRQGGHAMAHAIGKRLYRGVLKAVARVWNPTEIHDPAILQTVLAEMRTADVELRRLAAVLSQVEPERLTPILRSLRLNSIEQIDSVVALRGIIRQIERVEGTRVNDDAEDAVNADVMVFTSTF